MSGQDPSVRVKSHAGFAVVAAWFVLVVMFSPAAVFCQPPYFTSYTAWKSGWAGLTTSVAIGDVDGDGDLDLVRGADGESTFLYLNTGGTFEVTPAWSSSAAGHAMSVVLGDVDGDGDLDLVCGNNGESNALYRNAGGTFKATPGWSSRTPAATYSVVLGDVDGDGDLDLVCGNYNQKNTLYRNTGSTFTSAPVWSSGPGEATSAIALGDVDGDGDLDLVCGNSGAGNTLYRNNGGVLETWPSWSSGPGEVTISVALGDVDGDGDLDLVCGNFDQSTTIHLNTGGVFDASPAWSSAAVTLTFGVSLGDVDGDGDLDLVCGNFDQSNSLYVNGGGALETSPSWTSRPTERTNSVALGDVDGDGDLDLVCGNYGESDALYLNAGGALAVSAAWASATTVSTASVALGDVDRDGDLDLVCGNNGASNTLRLNTGDSFESSPVWFSGPAEGTFSIAVGDIDGDGSPDLVCGNYAQSNTLYLNTSGVFEMSPSWSSQPAERTQCVVLGDVDGDGDLDLVCANWNESNSLYLNVGGAFETSPSWLTGSTDLTSSVALGDIDGDGDLDLICGNYHQSNTLHLNTGGVFDTSPAWSSARNEYTASVALGDIDGDGDLDLVCGNGGESNSLYLNAGGTFEPLPAWTSGPTDDNEYIALGDVDGDGDLDLICGNYDQRTTLYLNVGGVFEISPGWSSGATQTTVEVALADVDRDGDLDLVCANNKNGVALYKGKAAPAYKGAALSPTNQLPNNGAHVRFVETEKTRVEYYRVDFTAVDVESDPIWIVAQYQYAGEPMWQPAIVDGAVGKAGPFATSPAGVRDSLVWDTQLLPFDPREVNLRLRVIEVPKRVSTIQYVAPYLVAVGPVTPYRAAISAADTLSFPAVTLGDTTYAALRVANPGTAVLTITDVDLFMAGARIEDTFPMSIAPRGSTVLTLRLAPGNDSGPGGNIVIHSDDPFSPSTVVQLKAKVRPLEFTLANLYPAGEIVQGTALGISIVMQDYVHVDSARAFYREGGKESFRVIPLTPIQDPVNEQHFGVIPSGSVSARGIEYFVRVYNSGYLRESPLQRLRTRVKNMDFAVAPPVDKYAMISIPLDLDGPILGVLSDDLGGPDITQWRLWEYNSPAAAYAELPNDTTTDFRTGQGYWLIRRPDHRIDTGPAEGLSISTESPFLVPLSPGWNMIGNPFAFPVAWDSITVEGKRMSEAEGSVVETPRAWSAAKSSYNDPMAEPVETLVPFAGYWLRNRTDSVVVLSIPPRESPAVAPGGSRVVQTLAGGPGGWLLRIRATCAEVSEGGEYVGVRPGASDGWDRNDRSAAPMNPGRGISVYFPHRSWAGNDGDYSVDIRQPSAHVAQEAGSWGHQWVFDAEKNFSEEAAGDEVTLEFTGLDGVPADAAVLLVDRSLGRQVDLREESRYAFFLGARGRVTAEKDARFLLLVGSDEFVASQGEALPGPPKRTTLYQNHPNPFNPSTIIRYELARPGRVTLNIYDVKGALVKRLEDRIFPAGRYEVGWNGENEDGSRVASGVYFYRLETIGYSQTRKAILLK